MNKVNEVQEGAAAPKKEMPGAAAPAKTKRKGGLMYLGPTITGVVRHSTVFKDGTLPKEVQECIARLPVMERLFVEVDKVPGAVKELRRGQGVLGTVYARAEAHFNAQKSLRR